MLYFSEINGKQIQTEDGIVIGRLEDLVFLASETPRVTKIVVRSNHEEKMIIPIEFLKKINKAVVITKNYNIVEIAVNELFILKNLLDKQIIDLKGNKVVRVNDVAINDKPLIYISGVDIGIIGILRRLGLEGLFYRLSNFLLIKYNTQFLSWADIQPLELSRGKVVLNLPQEKLSNLHPADLADHLEKTNIKNVFKLVNLLDQELATKVIAEFNPNYQLTILRKMNEEKAQKLIAHMDIDEAVDVLSQFNQKKRDYILEKLDVKKKMKILHMLKFSGTTIGKYLSSEFITTKPEQTVASVIEKIKKETADLVSLDYIYVINDQNQLVGVFNLHELLIQPPETSLYKFMSQNLIVAHFHSPLLTVTRKLIKYHLYAIPIVDANKKIIGVIKIDDIGELYLSRL